MKSIKLYYLVILIWTSNLPNNFINVIFNTVNNVFYWKHPSFITQFVRNNTISSNLKSPNIPPILISFTFMYFFVFHQYRQHNFYLACNFYSWYCLDFLYPKLQEPVSHFAYIEREVLISMTVWLISSRNLSSSTPNSKTFSSKDFFSSAIVQLPTWHPI